MMMMNIVLLRFSYDFVTNVFKLKPHLISVENACVLQCCVPSLNCGG